MRAVFILTLGFLGGVLLGVGTNAAVEASAIRDTTLGEIIKLCGYIFAIGFSFLFVSSCLSNKSVDANSEDRGERGRE